MDHTTVYSTPGIYAGWPANHGSWQWGPEFLVGFLVGEFKKHSYLHSIKEPYKKVMARSLDAGETWSLMIPNKDFEAKTTNGFLPKFNPSNDILRVCGGYDHGGEYCVNQGGVYLSTDRGWSWIGAFDFFGRYANIMNTSRTCVLDDLLFASARHPDYWGSDFTFCLKWNGTRFAFHSFVLNDDYRAVMPAAARVGNRIVVALRRRGPRIKHECWIDAVHSDDNGRTWSVPHHVADTGGSNGNPPALVASGDKFYCAHGNREHCQIWLWESLDGVSWKQIAVLRSGSCFDIGYPRLFAYNGNVTCVYYWSDKGEEQRIEATRFSPS